MVILTITVYGENPIEIIIKNEATNWIPIITLSIVFLGFIGTIYATSSNKKIEVLSKNRQEWINTLRNELSNYIGKLNEYRHVQELDDIAEIPIRNLLIIQEVTTMSTKIELLLNPKKQIHQDLIELIKKINEDIQITGKISSREKFIEYSQKILKEEWERVKEGK